MVHIPATERVTTSPPGMVLVPKGRFHFVVSGVEIEGDDEKGVDVQYPWEEHPQRSHNHTLEVGPLYMDRFPVTNANYSQFLHASGYRPRDPYNWLKHWGGNSSTPPELADRPVTYVSLREARAYCSWAGARLPHSWEWQYAAQGVDGRLYPWGNSKDQGCFPVLQNGSSIPGPEPIGTYSPSGDSPFGISDLVGNIWQFTDEFVDAHTRSVILRGGSNYRPIGSMWYFPQALELNRHEKYFLMDDSYERAGTVGFRCVVDADETQSEPPRLAFV